MTFCTNCGQQLTNGVKFCSNCGTAVNQSAQSRRETIYEGKIHKCPNCGEISKSFIAKCPICGHEFRGTQCTSAVKEFALKLEEIEKKKMPEERASFLKTLTGLDFNKKAVQEKQKQFEEQKIKEKINLISSFSIPNTKEDILEFLLLSSNKFDVKNIKYDELSKAWFLKFKQIYEKAVILLSGDSDFIRIQAIYEAKNAELKNFKRGQKIKIAIKIVSGLFVIIFGLIMGIIGFTLGEASGDSDSGYYGLVALGVLSIVGSIFIFIPWDSMNRRDN